MITRAKLFQGIELEATYGCTCEHLSYLAVNPFTFAGKLMIEILAGMRVQLSDNKQRVKPFVTQTKS